MTVTEDRTSTRSSAWGLDSPREDPEPWKDRGLCSQTDPEAFFPEKGGSTREAKRICMGCEVRDECLNDALDRDERFGVWGGFSDRERRRMKRGEILKPRVVVSPDPDEHGSYARFRRGCTCDLCRAAYNAYHRDWEEQRRVHPACVVCGGTVRGRGRHRFCSQACKESGQ